MICRALIFDSCQVMHRCAVLGVLLMCGCDSGNRQSIAGTVTLDGQPPEKGTITFLPQSGTQGPTAGAEIAGGKYAIPTAGGTFAGKFRVEITVTRPNGKKMDVAGQLYDIYEQFIPPKYNTASQLEAEVKVGAENHFEFAVNSK